MNRIQPLCIAIRSAVSRNNINKKNNNNIQQMQTHTKNECDTAINAWLSAIFLSLSPE